MTSVIFSIFRYMNAKTGILVLALTSCLIGQFYFGVNQTPIYDFPDSHLPFTYPSLGAEDLGLSYSYSRHSFDDFYIGFERHSVLYTHNLKPLIVFAGFSRHSSGIDYIFPDENNLDFDITEYLYTITTGAKIPINDVIFNGISTSNAQRG